MASYSGVKVQSRGGMLVGAFVLLVIGVVFGINSFMNYRESKYLESVCTESVQGTVTDTQRHVRTHRSSKGRRRTTVTYTMRVEYEVNNEPYVTSYSSSTSAQLGTPVMLKYNPDKPSECYRSGTTPNDWPVAAVISGVMLLISLIQFIRSARVEINPQKNVAGQTFEQWQAQQKEKERMNAGMGIEDADRSFAGSYSADSYYKESGNAKEMDVPDDFKEDY